MASQFERRGFLVDRRWPGPIVFSTPMILGLATLVVFLLAMVVLAVTLPTVPEAVSVFPPPYYLGTWINLVFMTGVPLLVSYYAGRIYLVTGIQAFLYLCSAMIILAFSATISAFMADTGDANAAITIFNLSALCSSILHFSGCLTLYRGDGFFEKSQRSLRLLFTWLAGTGLVLIISLSALASVLPPFFVPGSGSSPIREIVLHFCVFFFLISSVLTFLHYRAAGERSFFWYALGVALLATGILDMAFVRAPFDLINWLGRVTQAIGSVFFLIAVLSAFKTYRKSCGGIDQAVREFYRSMTIHFHDLIESANDAIVSFVDDRMAVWNAAAEGLFGYSREEAAGLTVGDIFKDGGLEDLLRRQARPEEPLIGRAEVKAMRKGGEEFPVEISISKREVAGQTATTFSIRDISQRKRMEEKLRTSERRFRALFENSLDGVMLTSTDGSVLSANKEMCRILGMTEKEIKEKAREGIAMHDEKLAAALEERSRTGRFRGEVLYRRKDGSPVPVEVSSGIFEDGSGKLLTSTIVRDVAERRRSEEALRESQALYRAIAHNFPNGAIYIFDRNLRFRVADGQEESLFDHDMEGKTLSEATDEETCKLLEQRYRQVLEGESLHFETLLKGRIFSSAYVPIRDEEGTVIAGMVVSHDITEHRQAEEALRKAHGELELRVRERTVELEQRNLELQNFTFVAAHDLQEPLRKIQTFGDLVARKCSGSVGGEGLDYIGRMRETAARMQKVLHSLVEYSKLTSSAKPFRKIDLGQVAREAVSDFELRIRDSGASVEIAALPEIEADPGQMIQLLQNLLGNALKFRRASERPVVRIHAECRNNGAEKRHCKIYVEDNGIGFNEVYIDKIFDPFQRLHSAHEYEGVGMGLAICRKIVERHGGEITAKSTPGKGSTFIVLLPVRQPGA